MSATGEGIHFTDRTTKTKRERTEARLDLIAEFAKRFDVAVTGADQAAMAELGAWAVSVGLHTLAEKARRQLGEM